MNSEHPPRSMDQKIFQVDLSTEAVSAYLLCCGLADEGNAVSVKNLLSIWNSSKSALLSSLDALEGKRILQKKITDREENTVYELTDVHQWDLR